MYRCVSYAMQTNQSKLHFKYGLYVLVASLCFEIKGLKSFITPNIFSMGCYDKRDCAKLIHHCFSGTGQHLLDIFSHKLA